MTTEQKIELLATKVMGWKKIKWVDQEYSGYSWVLQEESEPFAYKASWSCEASEWNPYENWNHTHQVLDKVIEDPKLHTRFIHKMMFGSASKGNGLGCVRKYMKANQETLMDAVISAYTSES